MSSSVKTFTSKSSNTPRPLAMLVLPARKAVREPLTVVSAIASASTIPPIETWIAQMVQNMRPLMFNSRKSRLRAVYIYISTRSTANLAREASGRISSNSLLPLGCSWSGQGANHRLKAGAHPMLGNYTNCELRSRNQAVSKTGPILV